jgi:hypothetical protein
VKNVQATIAKKRAERGMKNATGEEGQNADQEQEDDGFTKVEYEGEASPHQ